MSEAEEHLKEQKEEIEDRAERLQEKKEAYEKGEVPTPWPHSSWNAFVIAAGTLVTGGALIGSSALFDTGGGFALAGLMCIVAGVAVASYGRWITKHFETGPQPTYDRDTDSEETEEVAS